METNLKEIESARSEMDFKEIMPTGILEQN
jgi:hypothetical protein